MKKMQIESTITSASLVLGLVVLVATSSSTTSSVSFGGIESQPPKTSVSLSTSIVEQPANNLHSIQANRFRNEDAIVHNSAAQTHNGGENVKLMLPQQHEYHYLQPQSINYVAMPVINEQGRILDGTQSSNQAPRFIQVASPAAWHYATPNLINQIQSRDMASTSTISKRSGESTHAQHNEIVRLPTQVDHSGRREHCAKCPSKGLGNVLKRAKNLLTGGFASIEERATTGNLMLGSSVLAAIIPLVALLLPDSLSLGGLMAATKPGGDNNGSAGKRAAASIGAGVLQGRVESVIGWVERSIGHLPNFPRLHPQECVKRSICEAHNDPTKYGALGFTLRLMFPATNSSNVDEMDYRVSNKYRRAASFGLDTRLGSNGTNGAACKDKYEDCLVNLLDVAQNLVDFFLKSKED